MKAVVFTSSSSTHVDALWLGRPCGTAVQLKSVFVPYTICVSERVSVFAVCYTLSRLNLLRGLYSWLFFECDRYQSNRSPRTVKRQYKCKATLANYGEYFLSHLLNRNFARRTNFDRWNTKCYESTD